MAKILTSSDCSFCVEFGNAISEEINNQVRSFTVAFAIGMLLFGPTPGILADRFGSYVPAYAFFAATLILSMVIVQYAYRKLNTGLRPKRAE